MQPLLAPPRQDYNESQVRAALTATHQEWGYGVELLTPDLTFVEDISDDVFECTVARDSYATVHGAITIGLSRSLRWGYDRIRPYQLLTSADAGVTDMRFDMGVYILQSPKSTLSETPTAYRATGRDQIGLLQYYATESWSVASGDNVFAAIAAVLSAAGVTAPLILASDRSDAVVPAGGRTWPLIRPNRSRDDETRDTAFDEDAPYRWITIVNDLLAMIGYIGLYADWAGTLRSEPATRASDRRSDWDFDMGSPLRIVADRTAEWDVWDAYNRWIFYQSGIDGDPVEGVSQITIDNLDVGPASQLALGVRQAAPESITAADYSALKAAANARAENQIAGTRTLKTTVSKMPVIWHRDTCLFTDAAAGAARWRIVSQSWRLALHDSSDQTIDWKVVSDAL